MFTDLFLKVFFFTNTLADEQLFSSATKHNANGISQGQRNCGRIQTIQEAIGKVKSRAQLEGGGGGGRAVVSVTLNTFYSRVPGNVNPPSVVNATQVTLCEKNICRYSSSPE